MNSLIEKVARVMAEQASFPPFDKLSTNTKDAFRQQAAPFIVAVLDHFSDPANVTEDVMARAATEAGICYNLMESPYQGAERNLRWQWRFRIAAAMKAAKEEMK